MGLPVEINNLMLGSLGGYTVGRSLRFRNSATAYLSRSPASAGNQQKMTFSFWAKRGQLGVSRGIYCSGASGSGATQGGAFIQFQTTDTLTVNQQTNNAYDWILTPTQVFRDPSAWYHIVVAIDTTQATASNRVLMYVNGVQVTSFSSATYPTLNLSTKFNASGATNLGATIDAGAVYFPFDGYLAEVNFIDGQALTPSSFGAYDTNGVWQPKKYTGTYGTNGFYLPFSNTTSTTTLVQDSSGNGNNWTPNNISLTAGTTYDSMIDSPTNAAGTSTGIGNYCVINPLDFQNANTYSNANLSVSLAATTASLAFGTMGVSSGKWYWEVKTNAGANPMLGVATQAGTLSSRYFTGANSVYYYGNSGNKYVAGTGSAYGATYTTTDTIGIALDMDGSTITFYKNNVSQGAISLPSSLIGQVVVPAFTSGTGTAAQGMDVNFGQRPFSYTPPSGYKALNTYNLPAPSIANGAQYMAATLWTGDGTTPRTLTNGGNNTIGVTFQPDFVWIKERDISISHTLFNSIVGAGANKGLASDTTDSESSFNDNATFGYLSAFNSNGFSVERGSSGTTSYTNKNSGTYVAWQWKGGGTGVTNNSGSITSTVSASPSSGFSIATYTGNGVNGASVGHGLGVAPNMILFKARNSAIGWDVYHSSVGNTAALTLNSTGAAFTSSTFFNNTSPSSTVITLGTDANLNGNTTTFVAYCFAAVRGYSAFGSYTGNGSSDGPFTYLGFRPRYVMIKRTDSANWWLIWDSSRNTYNVLSNYLLAQDSAGENNSGASPFDYIDALSNGFKIRSNGISVNASGGTYIYAAFAENPFNISRAK